MSRLTGDDQQPAPFEQWQQQIKNAGELGNITKDKRDVAFKSLAEEFFWLSHTIRLADNEHRTGTS